MPTTYTSADEIAALIGQMGLDLRTDDADAEDLIDQAAEFATGEVDFACQGKFSAETLATIQWVRNVATFLATEWFSLRRLNSVADPLAKACDRYREKLDQVQAGKAVIPNAARSRRPVTVSNMVTDLRRANNQGRVDTTRSTGVAKGYTRPTDPTAPDQR